MKMILVRFAEVVDFGYFLQEGNFQEEFVKKDLYVSREFVKFNLQQG